MRPIDADLAIEEMKKLHEADCEYYGADIPECFDDRRAINILIDLPSVDAVEVVRCENCKHYKKSEVSDRMMCWRKDVDEQPVCYDFNPNDFCSYGKRRTDGR